MRKHLGFIIILFIITVLISCKNNRIKDLHYDKSNQHVMPIVQISKGEIYGHDLVCWIDDYGFCYDLGIKGLKVEECAVEISEETNIDTLYSEDERLLLYPILSDCKTGYTVSIKYGGEKYQIGLIRFFQDISRFDSAYCYNSYSDPHADLKPMEPRIESLSNAKQICAYINGFSNDDSKTINITPIRLILSDGWWLEDERDPNIDLLFDDGLIGVIEMMDENLPYMLVKRDKLLSLLNKQYLGVGDDTIPYRLFISDDRILMIEEICNP